MRFRYICQALSSAVKKQSGSTTQKASVYTITNQQIYPEHAKIVDFRSDTFTLPTEEMRYMMYKAPVGDDVYGEDPTVNELENLGAHILGKEAGLFVPSGTMANLLAIMTHSENRGCEILVGDESHILLWEQAGAAQIAGVQMRTVKNKVDGTYDVDELISRIRDNKNHSFLPRTSLVCVENTHNSCGGSIMPLNWLRQVTDALRPLKIPVHMDGARFFNSAVASGVPAREICRDIDTINICLSKGLGAPIGSLLIGSKPFISRARYLRKVLGGGMRQVGIVAAAGIYALENNINRLTEDHAHTRMIAEGIHQTGSKIVTVDLDTVQTNILLINLDTTKVTAVEFCKRLATLNDEELEDKSPAVIKVLPWSNSIARLVVCSNNTRDDVFHTVKKLELVISEYHSGTYVEREEMRSSSM